MLRLFAVLASGGVFNQSFECLLVSWQPWRRCVLAAFFPTRWWGLWKGRWTPCHPCSLTLMRRWGCLQPPEELPLCSLLGSPLGLQLHAGNLPISSVLAKTSPSLALLQVTEVFKPWDPFCFWYLLSLPLVFWFPQNWWGGSSLMLFKLFKVFHPNTSQRKLCLQPGVLGWPENPKA